MHPPGTNPYLFSGKVAIITGGTSGIGKAAVAAFARAGAIVCYMGRRADLGEQQAKELRNEGYRVEFIAGDITREGDVRDFVARATDRHGRVDFAIHNAGVEAEPHALADITVEEFRRVLDTNVTGTFLGMKYAIPAIRASGGGSIVNVSSVLGQVALPMLSPYVAAKHAVNGLTKSAALELAQHAVRVNAVAPGAVNTDMLWRTMKDSEAAFQNISAMHPMGRVANPNDIVEAMLWLCSDASAFVTGQVLAVDGGFTAQ